MISRSRHVRSITSHISDPFFPYSWLLLGPWFSMNGPPAAISAPSCNWLECQFCELTLALWMQQKFWVQTQSLTKSFQLSQYILSFENDPTKKMVPTKAGTTVTTLWQALETQKGKVIAHVLQDTKETGFEHERHHSPVQPLITVPHCSLCEEWSMDYIIKHQAKTCRMGIWTIILNLSSWAIMMSHKE